VANDLILNAVPVEFSADQVQAWIQPFDSNVDLTALRLDSAGELEYRRRGTDLFTFRISASSDTPMGTRVELPLVDNLGLIAGLLPSALAARWPQYQPLRHRPFRFRGQRRNLVEGLGSPSGVQSSLLGYLDVAPRYELDGRVIETVDGQPRVVITVGISTDWQINGSINDLVHLGVHMPNHYVVWREKRPERGRLAGRLISIDANRATVLVNETDQEIIDTSELALESSRRAVAQVLADVVGDSAAGILASIDQRVGELLEGPALLQQVRHVSAELRKTPLSIADGLTCVVSELAQISRPNPNGPATLSRTVNYCFDSSRTKRDEYAWRGLDRYGPFSGDTFARRSPTILVVHPQSAKGQVETFVQAFRDGIHGPNLTAYQKGFIRTFGLTNPKVVFVAVPLSGGQQAAPAYTQAIEDQLAAMPAQPDAAIVVVRDQDARLPDPSNPYLHSKATLLMSGIPVQEIRLSTATKDRFSLQYILQNVAVALYAKDEWRSLDSRSRLDNRRRDRDRHRYRGAC
jgi:hypothetical protein